MRADYERQKKLAKGHFRRPGRAMDNADQMWMRCGRRSELSAAMVELVARGLPGLSAISTIPRAGRIFFPESLTVKAAPTG